MLTILFTPLDYHGHINACHGLADSLAARGHRCVFAIDQASKGRMKKYGYDEVYYENAGFPGVPEGENSVVYFINQMKDIFRDSSLVIAKHFQAMGFEGMFSMLTARKERYQQIIDELQPDVIVVDSYVGCYPLTNSGRPWVWLFSASPLFAFNNRKLPPPWSGLKVDASDECQEFWHSIEDMLQNLHNIVKESYESSSAPVDDNNGVEVEYDWSDICTVHPRSPYLNIYMTPEELDYQEIQPLPENWRRVDGFVRQTDETFELPDKLLDNRSDSKLVFLSMGSIGCCHIELMQRLIAIFGKSRHRFIVATGPLHDKIVDDLPDNMWGQEFVPQTAILPLVDLVITHCGNNTVTETFYYGKPMLALPLFGDQFENAQRLVDTGLGLRCHPLIATDDELLSSVDKLVDDQVLADKMRLIGERIRQSNDNEVVAKQIEDLIVK
ncbi:NDP-glycosyltransferase YjiC-like [Oppia nitens]|uniref:NDP-glycosyltransferase YjiC-like n=1 Tax=Oppia nitens TaxID=1686743 RepID=UPI0023DC0A8B|nr:NDP-glycosyltransferase YjiC-like [Oppia nitens]